jgi:circadian clock protein KaiB
MTAMRPPFKFRLYVSGDAPYSVQARANLDALCREYLPDGYDIEIVDVLVYPQRALTDGILLTPTLIRLDPEPVRRMVGSLNDTLIVLQILGLQAKAP